MGLIARILSFTRSIRSGVEQLGTDAHVADLKVDPGGGANVTADHYATPGDDSWPLATDYACLVSVSQSGRFAAVGYIDPINTPKAERGEKRTYSRDADGAVAAEHWLKADGSVVTANDNGSTTLGADGAFTATNDNGSMNLSAAGDILGRNEAGSFELQSGGDFVVNGVVITPAGLITTLEGIVSPSVIADGVEVVGHDHAQLQDSAGDTQEDTEAMK